ncbi:MAG TPA: hypothetical protein EYP41_05515 [Anaerolineae bacterium]|nr:hypothetical protein [Anaerolineae bacterium]HIP73132.1 hypothetical protein [Anaerolineae bacterium]
MLALHENFMTDDKGNRVGVLLDWQTYQKILDDLEELGEIRAFDAVLEEDDEIIPFEQAIVEIEQQ